MPVATRFAEQLLAGRRVGLLGADDAIAASLAGLGAEVRRLAPGPAPDEAEPVPDASDGTLQALVIDARAPGSPGDGAAVSEALGAVWATIHRIAATGWIPAGRGGRIILIGPAPGSAPLAGALTAGLENLARSLAVEWARFAITAVCLAPGDATTDAQLAELAAFLLGPGGGYVSGTRLSLGLAEVAARP